MFLTLRCILPKLKMPKETATYIANLGYFFNENHLQDAEKLMDGDLLGT